MKILLLTQWFDPEPTFKGLQFAKELQKRGHKVEVLTGFPNYPGGKVYEGYTIKPYQLEIIDEIKVHRVPLFPSHDNSAVNRVFNYFSFSLSASFLGSIKLEKPDVIYAYHPPATVGIPALILKKIFNAPVVYDIQDMWPDTIAATGMINNKSVLDVLGKFCNALYKSVDKVVVLSPGFKKLLIERGVPKDNIDVIYNWTYEDQIGESAALNKKKKLLPKDKFNIVFAGNMGKAQGLTAVLDAAKLLLNKDNKINFVFVGGGLEKDNLIDYAQKNNLTNVTFLDRLPVTEINGILSESDALLVHLTDDPLFEITIPSKIQSSLLSGKPILAGLKGDAADLIIQAKTGIVCEPMNPESIAQGALKLESMTQAELKKMGKSGLSFYQKNLSIAVGASKFEKLFNQFAVSQSVDSNIDFEKNIKRLVDLSASVACFAVTGPIMALAAAAIYKSMGSPVFFRQKRPGLNGRPFELLKFRTMKVSEKGSDDVSNDAMRITKVGKFLRAASIDELPTLINVLKGEMSLVGPRPLLMQYLDRYTKEQSRRHDVKPGITGWAQVNGRNALSWEEKFKYDVWYVDNQSLLLDMKIIVKTVLKVLQRDGISHDGEATMSEFMGTESK
ncbi:MAG: sugar transferase [Deltaproteobacteria bacterium]|nr:sugar transferase [Deltaproteobacteria bacterium]